MAGGVAGQCATLKPISKTQSPLTRRSDLLRIVPSLNGATLVNKTVIASEAKQSISDPMVRSFVMAGLVPAIHVFLA
jgi:integral membrane sensor domain MASE1